MIFDRPNSNGFSLKLHAGASQYVMMMVWSYCWIFLSLIIHHLDSLAQDCSNSSAVAMDLLQSCAEALISLITDKPIDSGGNSSLWTKYIWLDHYQDNQINKVSNLGPVVITLLAKKFVIPPLKTIKPMWIELLCFHLAEIGMIWTRDCSPTKSDTTLGRHSMQGQVGSSSSETTV